MCSCFQDYFLFAMSSLAFVCPSILSSHYLDVYYCDLHLISPLNPVPNNIFPKNYTAMIRHILHCTLCFLYGISLSTSSSPSRCFPLLVQVVLFCFLSVFPPMFGLDDLHLLCNQTEIQAKDYKSIT